MYASKQYSAAVAADARTATVDLGRAYGGKIFVRPTSMSTNHVVAVYASTDNTTYSQLMERVNTAPVQHQAITLATTTTGSFVELGKVPFRYLAFITTATLAAGGGFDVVCGD